jgi:hypothetical protein
MARFGKKLKVEWSNNHLLPTLLLLTCSGRWAAWRAKKPCEELDRLLVELNMNQIVTLTIRLVEDFPESTFTGGGLR